MSNYPPGRRLQWFPARDGGEVEIVYGPVNRGNDMGYLVMHLTGIRAGQHSLVGAHTLREMPRAGQQGRVNSSVPYTIHYIDDKIALLWRPEPEYSDERSWYHLRRAEFDKAWRPES